MVATLGSGEWLFVGALAGLLAGLAMDSLLVRQEDGFVPARVATALVTGRDPADVPLRDAVVLHHVVAVVAGVAYAALGVVLAAALPSAFAVAGVPLVAHALSVATLGAITYGLFAFVVFPRIGGRAYEQRRTAVRGQWLRAAIVFTFALFVAPLALAAAVP